MLSKLNQTRLIERSDIIRTQVAESKYSAVENQMIEMMCYQAALLENLLEKLDQVTAGLAQARRD